MTMFTIWVDADACPAAVKELIIRTALRLSLPACFVSNKPAGRLPENPLFTQIVVPEGPDVADAYIVEHAMANDLAITQDIPLAAALVAKEVMVLSNHGYLYTPANVGSKLATRNLMQDLRDTGTITGGPKPFSDRDKQQFANALDKAVTALLKKR